MKVLVIGGTRFIGPHVVRALASAGHQVTVFHRGHTRADFPSTVEYMIGDRRKLFQFRDQFQRLSPDLAIDMIAYTEEDALSLLRSLKGIVPRVVVVSSADVYRAYDRWRKVYCGPLESVPLTEDAPLREATYPYREKAKGPEDWLYHYDNRNWTPEEDKLLGTASHAAIGRRLGRSTFSVQLRRRRLGLPSHRQ